MLAVVPVISVVVDVVNVRVPVVSGADNVVVVSVLVTCEEVVLVSLPVNSVTGGVVAV